MIAAFTICSFHQGNSADACEGNRITQTCTGVPRLNMIPGLLMILWQSQVKKQYRHLNKPEKRDTR